MRGGVDQYEKGAAQALGLLESQTASAARVLADEKRAIGISDVAARAGRIAFLFAFDESETSEQRFLRTVLGQPAFRHGAAGFNSELARGKECAPVGAGLSSTDYLCDGVPSHSV